MKAINHWFKAHNDAILVTDKLNESKVFAQQLIDRQRLMMELFSWSAVKEGLEERIRSVMPTGKLVVNLGDEAIDTLRRNGISDVAAIYRILNTHSRLVKDLVESGINIYGRGQLELRTSAELSAMMWPFPVKIQQIKLR